MGVSTRCLSKVFAGFTSIISHETQKLEDSSDFPKSASSPLGALTSEPDPWVSGGARAGWGNPGACVHPGVPLGTR